MHQLPSSCISTHYITVLKLYCKCQLPAWQHTHRVKGRQKIGKWYIRSVHRGNRPGWEWAKVGMVLKQILHMHSQVSLAGSNIGRFWCPQAVVRNATRSSTQSKQAIRGMSCSLAAACLELLPLASTGNVVQYNISGGVPKAAGLCVQDISGVLI